MQAIHDELETIFDRYHETIGNRIESLPEGGALIFYYPVVNDYFTVYNGNSFLIGRVKNNDLRKSIIKTYTLGKGMMDSLRMNNEILQKVEHWESIHAETQLPIHQEKAKHYYMSLVEYAKSIKKQHLDLKDNLKSTLRALVKNGVLNESDQKKVRFRMNFDFDQMAYPDTFYFSGKEFKGSRNNKSKEIDIPYTDEPDLNIGDIVTQKVGSRDIHFKVIDLSITENGTLNVGTNHPHIMTLVVENLTENAHSTKKSTNTFNISSVSGTQVQIGENNSQVTNISLEQLVEKISSSEDLEAKTIIRKLLENSTVASILGAGSAALFGLLK